MRTPIKLNKINLKFSKDLKGEATIFMPYIPKKLQKEMLMGKVAIVLIK